VHVLGHIIEVATFDRRFLKWLLLPLLLPLFLLILLLLLRLLLLGMQGCRDKVLKDFR